MPNSKILFLILLTIYFAAVPVLLAQGVPGNHRPCPSGAAPVNGGCGSPSNASSSDQVEQVWRNHYGALAASKNGVVVASANNQLSMRAARKLAMKKCAEPSCRIVVEYVNSCGSVAWGAMDDNQFDTRAYAAGNSSAESDAKAIKRCSDAGGNNCAVEFTGCSLPVRVR